MIELNKIYNEDCLSLMKKIDDSSIDCIITSIPYNFDKDYDVYNDKKDFKEYEKWLKKSFEDSKYEYNVIIAGDVDEYISLIANVEAPDNKVKLIDKHITERILDIGV